MYDPRLVSLVDNLNRNAIPTVVGPDNKFFMTDHHHFCLAVYRARIAPQLKFVILNVSDNWVDMPEEPFWIRMLANGFFWPFDGVGTIL